MLIRTNIPLEDEIDGLAPRRGEPTPMADLAAAAVGRLARKRAEWTEEQDGTLRRLWQNGMTASEIAPHVDHSPKATSCRTTTIGLRRAGGARRGGLAAQFMAFVHHEPNTGCWLWDGSIDRHGYAQLRVAGGKLRPATHVALEIEGRSVPPGMFACHRCDNPACVSPDHLFVGSPRDNSQDAIAKGRWVNPPAMVGEANVSAKLTADEVLRLRRMRESGVSWRRLGRASGVSASAARNAVLGRTWRHV